MGWLKAGLELGGKEALYREGRLRRASLVLYDLSRVSFEGEGRRDWPVMERAGITERIGAQLFFQIGTHAQGVPVFL
ncbi:hypothetical protein MPNT_620002 [Candidatus Methylacidithermus pantelleriae]|uniref:Uncharacterized protein n=2 Tax=Candidatus Methylacidithermus pantelleriae TaxID=2744239 RepID=A0A8J2FXA1_9BACT|nr:hypothetical protein MPNT_620002 [Candidatus Methylacidithermus pantelleriae]